MYDLRPNLKVQGHVVFIYRHLAITARTVKMLDIINLGKVKFLTQNANITYALQSSYVKHETPLSDCFE